MNVTIATKNGPVTVTGYHSGVPGLVVTRDPHARDWSITHRASGFAVWSRFETRAGAIDAARKLAGLTDWTAPAEELGDMALLGAAVRDRITGRTVLSFDAVDDDADMWADLLPEGWETDGYGIDANLICAEHGHMIEQDGVCPDGCVSPLRTAGLI